MSQPPTSPSTLPKTGPLHTHPSSTPAIEVPQTQHRLALLAIWFPHGLPPSTRILELGCGQGDTTAVLAHLVGPTGHITALDPAPLDYGAPYTVGQAQSRLSRSSLGARITWVQADPIAYLEGLEKLDAPPFDAVVLAHCIWYMPSRDVLGAIFRKLRGRTQRLCVAEWALRASVSVQLPHVFAALARGALEAQRVGSEENVQSPLAPGVIREVAASSGWVTGGEQLVTPAQGLEDGKWEVGTVGADGFREDAEREIGDGRVREVVLSARAAMIAALEAVPEEGIRSMDVWVADLV